MRHWGLAAILSVLAASIGLPGLAARPQSPAAGAGVGVIGGRVIDATSNGPVTGVVVTLAGAGAGAAQPASVLVDSHGRFVFQDLPRGRFTLAARKTGFVPGAYGKLRVDGDGQPFDLGDGQRITDVTLRLWAFGSISGTVVDETGEPVVRMSVGAFQRTFVGGRPNLVTQGSGWATDDRGVFYDGSVWPGDYILSIGGGRLNTYPISFVEATVAANQAGGAAQQARAAELAATGAGRGAPAAFGSIRVGSFTVVPSLVSPLPSGSDRLAVFPRTYYPSASAPDAAIPITITPGEHRRVQFQIRRVPTMRISGLAMGPSGPIANLGLHLQLGGHSDFRQPGVVEPGQTVTAPDGGFTFLGVPAGEYMVWGQVIAPPARGRGPGSVPNAAGLFTAPADSTLLFGSIAVTVTDTDRADLQLVLRPPPTISGRIEFDGLADKPAQLTSIGLMADLPDGHFPLTGATVTLPVSADGSIAPRPVLPGQYFIRSYAPVPGWTLKSAVVQGRDVSDQPLTLDTGGVTDLVVTFTDHPLTMSGTVRTASGAADPSAVALIFPVDRALWSNYGTAPRRVRNVPVSATGAFSASGLPAGEYFVVATPDSRTSQWQDPAFLERATRVAARVRLQDGGANAVVDLRTTEW